MPTGAENIANIPPLAASLDVILPLTIFLIFLLLFALYNNFKFPLITVAGVLLSAPVGGILALFSPARLLGVVRGGLPGPVRRLGADRGGLYFLCQ